MGWVPSDHTFLFACSAKNAKNGTSKKHLDLGSNAHKPIYIFFESASPGEHLKMSIRAQKIVLRWNEPLKRQT